MNAMNAVYLDTFETLVANERTNLLRFCTHLTGSPQAAEDLTQETLLTAWRRRDAITDLSGLSHWLKAIARNVCRHWQRSQTRQNKHLLQSHQHDYDLAACRRSPFGVVFLRFEAAFPVKIRYFRPNMSLRPSKKWNLAINPTGC